MECGSRRNPAPIFLFGVRIGGVGGVVVLEWWLVAVVGGNGCDGLDVTKWM